jgi:hypothetical protein
MIAAMFLYAYQKQLVFSALVGAVACVLLHFTTDPKKRRALARF